MKDIKAFLRVPVEQGLPERAEGKDFDTNIGVCNYDKSEGWFEHRFDIENEWTWTSTTDVEYWFREISLSEYMVGFTQWLCKNFELHPKEEPFWYDVNLIVDKFNYKYYTTDYLLELYFIEQGIIIK